MKMSEIKQRVLSLVPTDSTLNKKTQTELLQRLGLEAGRIYQELEMDSRFVDTHRDISYSNANINLHSHDFYELLFSRSSGVEYLVGSERYRIRQGDIILIAPGISHRPLLPEIMDEPYVRDVLWISSEFMEALMKDFPSLSVSQNNYTALLHTSGNQQTTIGNLFNLGITEGEVRAPGWEMALMGNTVYLLSQLFRAFTDRSAAPLKAEKPELLNRVMAYVETHLEDKLTLQDMAHQFFVSESTISQIFRKKMGVSFHRCVTQRRLIAAKALITEGVALEIVGHQVGFSDYSTFYRAFKQEYGISPRQYRKLQEGNDPAL